MATRNKNKSEQKMKIDSLVHNTKKPSTSKTSTQSLPSNFKSAPSLKLNSTNRARSTRQVPLVHNVLLNQSTIQSKPFATSNVNNVAVMFPKTSTTSNGHTALTNAVSTSKMYRRQPSESGQETRLSSTRILGTIIPPPLLKNGHIYILPLVKISDTSLEEKHGELWCKNSKWPTTLVTRTITTHDSKPFF